MKILLIVGLFLWSVPTWAFRFSPMVVTLGASGSDATQTFLVENNGSDKIALQIETFTREMDVDGKESRAETDEFAVFPQQLVLEPGEKRNIRLTWIGDRQVKTELPYRLVISELPVNLKKPDQRRQGANLTFLLQYVASVYVTPPGAVSKISVESFKKTSDGKGELVLHNSGNTHRVLRGARVFLRSGQGTAAKRIEVTGDQIKDLEAENVLAGKSRRFVLNLPKTDGAVEAEVEFDSR